MQFSSNCFICSNSLLLHIRNHEKCWYCDHCREHFSASFQQQICSMNRSRLEVVNQIQPYRVERVEIPEVLA